LTVFTLTEVIFEIDNFTQCSILIIYFKFATHKRHRCDLPVDCDSQIEN